MPRPSKARRLMHDLTGATERRTTITLALLVIAVLLLPIGAMADTATEPLSRPAATEQPPPADDEEDPPGTGLDGGPAIPVLPAPEPSETEEPTPGPDSPTDEPAEGPREVEAEGDGAQEVVAPPVAPSPEVRQPDAQQEPEAAGEEVAAAGEGEQVATGDTTLEPLDPEAYGPQVVPSLGTATSPMTQPMVAGTGTGPLVLAPQVAADGSPIVAGSARGTAAVSGSPGLLEAVDPSRTVSAATLSIVQPSWYATTTALLVLLGAAAYGALLRRRGKQVPAILTIPTAVRPGDNSMVAARSVRPADITVAGARSVRP